MELSPSPLCKKRESCIEDICRKSGCLGGVCMGQGAERAPREGYKAAKAFLNRGWGNWDPNKMPQEKWGEKLPLGDLQPSVCSRTY